MDVSIQKVEDILAEFNYDKSSLVRILLETQEMSENKHVTQEAAQFIASKLKLPDNQIYEVLSFYSALNSKAKGKYHIEICDSTSCRVNKKTLIESYLEEALDISVGDTTNDNMFTLDLAPCFGACDVSPAMRINKKVYGHLTISKTKEILQELRGEQNE